MPWPVDEKFRIPANRDIVAFIERNPTLSAHSDVASLLTDSAKELRGAGRYCPDLHACAYFALYTMERKIFAVAYGMSALVFRLPRRHHARALAAGGVTCYAIGEEWIDFGSRGRDTDLREWCCLAYESAVESEKPI